MGKKAARIAELERQLASYRKAVADRDEQIDSLKAQIKRMASDRKPSLADTAKREWQQLTDRILEAVGL